MEKKETEKKETKQWTKEAIMKELLSWVLVIIAAFAFGYVLNHYVIIKAQVPSGSMKNTIIEGDRLLGLKIAYLFSI